MSRFLLAVIGVAFIGLLMYLAVVPVISYLARVLGG